MIRPASNADIPALAELANKLWPEASPAELAEAFRSMPTEGEAALFLCFEGSRAVGFAQCQLRRDYVKGTDSSPVGYLEGIFVEPEYRHRGCAKLLLAACEEWAKAQGCTEFASDCELDNDQSLAFHLRAGFTEANRIICFTKQI